MNRTRVQPQKRSLPDLLRDESAASSIEYVLLLAFVALPLGVIAWGAVNVLSAYLLLVAELVGDLSP